MKFFSALTVALLLALAPFQALADEVKVYEEPLTLPTYKVEDPGVIPNWNKRVYPYSMLDRIVSEKEDRTYRALYVENEYVKALVLPELGGRLHGALDKTNGYQFLYDQKVIKPGLVGLTGAWISGGVEWNFPDGHRASGFREIDYRLVENPDGSRTAWVGEIDRVSGMRWCAGTTVYPGRSWVETKMRLYNSTSYIKNYQFWATSAVRATYEYQAVIPGEIVTGHAKHGFFRWPVNDGVNITYWKNLPGATSFFAWESQADYFGGYSPEEKAGFVHVADHHIVRGKKLWSWGTSPSGRIWEEILTDGDLPYFEPQAGGYSDNQPDLHWIMPGETKVFSHFWIPVRDIGVYDYANLEGTLNIELKKRKARFGWSPTGVNGGAEVILTAGAEEVFRQTIDAGPATPFLGQATVPKGTDLYALRLTVVSSRGDTLLAFQHPEPTNPPMPESAPPPPAPEETESQDELFVIGDHFDRFRDPARGMLYYREALKRDPGDVRSNTAVGQILLKQARFTEALEHFEKALERDPAFYKAWYFKGITLLRLDRREEAENSLNRASYDLAFYGAAHFELAQLTAGEGRMKRALEHIERSIRGNGDNAQAHAVKALILNRLGRHEEALETALAIQTLDPLDYLSLAERAMALSKLGRSYEVEAVIDTILSITRKDSENHLELAIRYIRCGQLDEAALVLKTITDNPGPAGASPMVYYYLAYTYHLLGDNYKAESYLAATAGVSARCCFPSRLESLPVLRWAIGQKEGQDAVALYLIGNLYYSLGQADQAIEAWKKSVAIEPASMVAQRNLGYALVREDELEQARTAYEAAVEADPGEAFVAAYELDILYHKIGLSNQERSVFLEKNINAVSSYDPALKRLISAYVQLGRYNDALKWLSSRHFKSWEGKYDVHQYWVESHIKQGDIEFEAGNCKKALEHYELSLTYPLNLEVAEQPNTIHARKRFKIGVGLAAVGKKRQAKKLFKLVVADQPEPTSAYQYFRGKALEKLGKKDQARKVYEELLEAVEKHVEHDPHGMIARYDPGRNPEALKLFKRSLALDGLGRTGEAAKGRKQALEMDPKVALRSFSPPRAGW
ncbi:MAG: DUF5107 domain-containing protein [Gemmatimonadota bacterium]|nr:DUF5107 domain-containing protein [Gemmatimonadota bacterium]